MYNIFRKQIIWREKKRIYNFTQKNSYYNLVYFFLAKLLKK